MTKRDDFGGQIIESDSESDDSIDYDMEDEDDDESLDDDDLGMYPSSPVRKSGGIFSVSLVFFESN